MGFVVVCLAVLFADRRCGAGDMKEGYLKSFALGLMALASVLSVQKALATDVSGTLSSDTVWGVSGSPYVVTGTVLVSSGVKLTVEAGVEVKFASGKSLQVFGELVAKGTSSSGIVFTSVQESKAAGDWGQIMFYDSSVDASYDGNGDYASGSILEYCTVEYGSGIQLKLSTPFINQSTIRYHSGTGIGMTTDWYAGTAVLKITNNTISNNIGGNGGGIKLYWWGQNAAVISGNTISNNVGSNGGGIVFDVGSAIISGNTIENNTATEKGGGIRGRDAGTQILNNIIKGNQASQGGGIAGGGTVTGNTIISNTAGNGGGIYRNNTMPISNNYILNNTASSSGGGVVSETDGDITPPPLLLAVLFKI
jgi:parallel beta-helix repeat protein